ncbi:MAG: SGNH/GDSL hydrolase family protein [Nitrososphaera sp.]
MLRKTIRVVKIKSHGFLINLALLIISTVFAFLLSELALRLMGWSPLYVSPERDRFWKYDALLGWTHQPGQAGIFETPQFRTFVRINQKGLRDREHSYERPNDTRRILVIGDSFAWGYGVEESERFSQRLETSLGVEVINAGVSGYSTDQELLWFRGEGVKYDTDLVILVFAGNDIGDNYRQLVHTIYYKPQFVREEDQLILTGYPVPRTSPQGRFIYSLSQRSALAYFLVQRYFDFLSLYRNFRTNSEHANASGPGISSTREPFGLTIALLDEMRNIAESKEARFMIVATDRWWNNPSGETYKDFIDTLQTEGFLVLDVESRPGFDRGEMLIPDDGHWSRAGHEFVADKIKELIESNQLLGQPQ